MFPNKPTDSTSSATDDPSNIQIDPEPENRLEDLWQAPELEAQASSIPSVNLRRHYNYSSTHNANFDPYCLLSPNEYAVWAPTTTEMIGFRNRLQSIYTACGSMDQFYSIFGGSPSTSSSTSADIIFPGNTLGREILAPHINHDGNYTSSEIPFDYIPSQVPTKNKIVVYQGHIYLNVYEGTNTTKIQLNLRSRYGSAASLIDDERLTELISNNQDLKSLVDISCRPNSLRLAAIRSACLRVLDEINWEFLCSGSNPESARYGTRGNDIPRVQTARVVYSPQNHIPVLTPRTPVPPMCAYPPIYQNMPRFIGIPAVRASEPMGNIRNAGPGRAVYGGGSIQISSPCSTVPTGTPTYTHAAYLASQMQYNRAACAPTGIYPPALPAPGFPPRFQSLPQRPVNPYQNVFPNNYPPRTITYASALAAPAPISRASTSQEQREAPKPAESGVQVLTTRNSNLVKTNSGNIRKFEIGHWVPISTPNSESWQSNASTKDLLCKFCHNDPSYNNVGHQVRDRNGTITCPVLRAHKCEICGATGNDAHTKKFCPNKENESK